MFLAIFFFVAMAYLLLVPRRHRTVCVVLAVASAVGASLSLLQGFAAWPVGLICLLWAASRRSRRTQYEVAAWSLCAVITAAVYCTATATGAARA